MIEAEGNFKNLDQKTIRYRLNHTMPRAKDPDRYWVEIV